MASNNKLKGPMEAASDLINGLTDLFFILFGVEITFCLLAFSAFQLGWVDKLPDLNPSRLTGFLYLLFSPLVMFPTFIRWPFTTAVSLMFTMGVRKNVLQRFEEQRKLLEKQNQAKTHVQDTLANVSGTSPASQSHVN